MSVQPSSRLGSVGKLAPGMAAQIRDPETGEPPFAARHRHALAARTEYFRRLSRRSETHRRRAGRWLVQDRRSRRGSTKTASFSSRAGFRASPKSAARWCRTKPWNRRFAKRLQLPKDERVHRHRRHSRRGERRSAGAAEHRARSTPADLRAKLSETGLPNLWIPKKVQRVEAIPVLASGKLDIKGCRELALAERR